MIMRTRCCVRYLFVLSLLYIISIPLSSANIAESPQEVVQQTSAQMLAALQKNRHQLADNSSEIVRLVDSIIAPRFDFTLISRWVLGKHWRQASAEQKVRFTQAFRTLLIRTYAHALIDYADEEIVYLQTKLSSKNKALVRSEIRPKNGPAIPLSYKLYHRNGIWKAYDVIVDGISLVANYRASMAAEIRKGGIERLITKLDERNAAIRS